LIFCLFQTGFLQTTQAVKIKFEIDKKIKFKNQFRELEISKSSAEQQGAVMPEGEKSWGCQ
jgi:hypothetical protein